MVHLSIVPILLVICLSYFSHANFIEPAQVTFRYLPANKFMINITRSKEQFGAVLIERLKPSVDLNVVSLDGSTIQIPVKSRGRIFDGHIDGCLQCKSTVIWFADVDVIYGIFNFLHHKLYLESKNFDGKDYYFYRVPQTVETTEIENQKSEMFKFKILNNTLCTLSVHVDHALYQRFFDDYLAVYRYVITTVEYVNQIYKSIVFGRTKDNELITGIHFGLVQLTIVDGKDYDYGNDTMVVTDKLLHSFRKTDVGSNVCLAVMITGRELMDDNIGSSITGKIRENDNFDGVCGDRFNGESFNTVAITMAEQGEIATIFDGHRYLAHELGHSFGAYHDEKYFGSITKTLMAKGTTDGDEESHHSFSARALESMKSILMAVCYKCLEWSGYTQTCGNDIVELSEQCDPGLDGGDSCCSNTCRLTTRAQCSPRHEDCCLESCSFAPNTQKCPMQPDGGELVFYCTGTSTSCSTPSYYNTSTWISVCVSVSVVIIMLIVAVSVCKNIKWRPFRAAAMTSNNASAQSNGKCLPPSQQESETFL